ncbi:MAG: hydrolase 1, exosortase A system-associated [Paucibacter sp.]|nr:hydrolase 1, exosortase A system-associated [Roseateles sp.]
MKFRESVLPFECLGEPLLGVLSAPQEAASDLGVLVIVGGPQYRAGSHRQFTLLARALAAAGHPVLRFDYRGMGDSGGDLRSFEAVSDDIRAAIDALCATGVREVVLWGLCDAASAALLYCDGTTDPRVRGLCLLNPWVRSEASLARTQVKHYYLQRLGQPEFWSKLLRGQVAGKALRDLWSNLRAIAGQAAGPRSAGVLSFQQRMARALRRLDVQALLILSGNDYTAREFLDHARVDPAWRGVLDLPMIRRVDVESADHTFSCADWRAEVEQCTEQWLRALS